MAGGSLADLLADAQAGDEEALEELLEELRPRVRGWLRGWLASAPSANARAAELTQDVLGKLATAYETCRADTDQALIAWVRTIARRARADWHRQHEAELDARAWSGEPEREVVEVGVGDPHQGGGDDLVGLVLGELLLDAQESLSPETRQVIRQRLLYGATWQEAGESIGTSSGGARSRWRRARDRMRREIMERVAELPDPLRTRVYTQLGESV